MELAESQHPETAIHIAQDELYANLLDLLAGQTRLLEHKAEAEAPPPRGS